MLCLLQKVDELAEIAVTAHNNQGEHDKAVEAAQLIRSVPRRMAKLQMHGYWKPLADLTQALHQPLPSLHIFLVLQPGRCTSAHAFDGSTACWPSVEQHKMLLCVLAVWYECAAINTC